MKIVNVIGGLGNQMFQYAFAMALQERYKDEETLIDISHFNGYGLHNGYEIDSVFGKGSLKIALPMQLIKSSYYIPFYKISRIIRQLLPLRHSEYLELNDYVYDNIVTTEVNKQYFEGYWQSANYFDCIRDKICTYFCFKIEDKKNLEFINIMHTSASVGLHIRRGDYLGSPWYKDICTLEYYKEGIKHILQYESCVHFFIFSNDMKWCQKNLNDVIGDNLVTFVSHNKGKASYKDMALMSECKHLVIANSSFSWWGAYLNQRNGIIVAPKQWVNRPYETTTAYWKWHLYNQKTKDFEYAEV